MNTHLNGKERRKRNHVGGLRDGGGTGIEIDRGSEEAHKAIAKVRKDVGLGKDAQRAADREPSEQARRREEIRALETEVVRLSHEGWTGKDIAALFGIGVATVSRILKEAR